MRRQPGEPGNPVFVDDGRRRRRVAVLGWSAGLPLAAWLVLAPASLLGASWVPSLPLLPKVRIDSPALRASGTGAEVPITLPEPPTTQGAGGETTAPSVVPGAHPTGVHRTTPVATTSPSSATTAPAPTSSSASTPGATPPSVVPTTPGATPPSVVPTTPGATPPSVVPTSHPTPTHTTPTHTTHTAPAHP